MKKRFLSIIIGVFGVLALFSLMAKRTGAKKNAAKPGKVVVAAPKKMRVVAEEFLDHGKVIPDFDEKSFSAQRRAAVKGQVDKAAIYLGKHDLATAFNAFTYGNEFVRGELYIFAYDMEGTCLAIGTQRDMLWQNLYDYQDNFGTYVVREIINAAKKGGGWVVYEWRNATKVSYIVPVKKDGKVYAVGCGFYPHSKRDAVINLVNGAVSYFDEVMKRNGSVGEAFSRFNYALGTFVFGDLYLFALRSDGTIMAQGDRPGLIGQNALNHQDARGKYMNKEIIEKLKTATNGVWTEYISKRAEKLSYARKVTDRQGKNYFIACGYYPTADRRAVVDLARKGFRYMEMHGVSQSAEEFTAKRNMSFRFGDLFLFLYDLKGNVIAHGGNPDYVDKNQYELVDEDGVYYVQAIIEKAKRGGGWIDYRENNSSRFVYVEPIELGQRKFVIGSGLHPISKPEMMQLLVKRGVSSLEDLPNEHAFGQFVKRGGDFIKGDLDLFVFDNKGICYAYGEDADRIWKNMSRERDQNGRFFVKEFIKTAKDGPGIVEYKMNNATKVAYVESIEKAGVSYVVGSSFYRKL